MGLVEQIFRQAAGSDECRARWRWGLLMAQASFSAAVQSHLLIRSRRIRAKRISEPDGDKSFRFWSLALRAALGPQSFRRPARNAPARAGLSRHPVALSCCSVWIALVHPALRYLSASLHKSAASDRTGSTYRHQAFSRSSRPGPRWVTRILSPGSRRADAVLCRDALR
jgi:hypothetical protein